jgi:hypothetical protein
METAEGEDIAVGKITYGTGHAPLEAGLQAASSHYDDTGQVGAYVRATNGRFGPWMSGALRSDISPEGIRDLKANPPSGDWRLMKRALELIAALAVPVPGFPVQVAMTASGLPAALILGLDEEEEEMTRGRSYTRRKAVIKKGIQAAVLTAKKRSNLSRSSFAIPETKSYQIQDRAHAENALARSSGKAEEGRVKRAVCRRYPDMPACK